MTKEVAFLRNWYALRERPGYIYKRYGATAYTRTDPKLQAISLVLPTEEELDELLKSAGLPTHPRTDEYFSVTQEQFNILGIDPSRLP